ncbi:DMT family transporter [Aliiroseovarius sp. F47248L]|uniref:DMT family transporter n=1 Tax=Aliiroseovarius sp. F47248L TaxID=2926420 RepID=UPI001FF1CA59|nr:DMT family transporter [Aliiroseovarius sp. F47248L]MCK0137616.1 DMT family transporter [Aliiroseovarius sp. F47248L]
MSIATPAVQRPLFGILWMLAAGLFFVLMNALVKHVGQGLPSAQAAFLRFAFGLVFVLPALGQVRRVRFSRKIWRLFALRGLVHSGAVLCWFYAMTQITVAEVVAMNYLNPIYVMLGAALFLGETFSTRRMIAVAFAFLGVLIILRPGLRELGPGHLSMVFTAIFLGASYLIAKRLSQETSAAVVVAMMSITVTIGLTPVAWVVWVVPTITQLGWLVLVAFFATAGHYAMTRAFAEAPVSVTQPVTFVQIIWAAAMGAWLFAEPVDIWVVAGAGVIIGAVSYITWREAMLNRRITPNANAAKS